MSFASKGFVISEIEKRIAASGGGGVSTTGDALSGAGTSGDPLAVAPVLEALVDGGGTATAGAGTVLDLSATGGLLTGDGSAAAPSLAFSAEPGTGFFRGGAGYAALALSGTERFGFLNSGGASVFNALSPVRIAVNGNTILSYNESDPGVDLGTGGALAFGTGANDPRLVRTGTDEMSVRDGSGNDVTMLAGIFGSKASSNLTIKTGTQNAVVFTYASNPIATFNGPIRAQAGSASAVALGIAGDANTGLYGTADVNVSTAVGGVTCWTVSSTVNDGSALPLLNKVSCVTSLATAAAPTLITPGQTNTYFDNDGGTAIHYFTLPTTWVRGLQYHFTCVTSATSVGIRIQCSPNQTIVVGTAVTTTTSGYIEAYDRGSHITLTAVTSGTYYATGGIIGSWDIV